MQGYYCHPTAVVDTGVEIGNGTRIWHFCHISEGARIGESCALGQNVFIDRNVPIGDGVKIQNNVSVYQGVTIEDYVFLGPSCVFTNILTPRSAFPRNDPAADFLPTRVRCGASIGANATICCGTEIGSWSMVGAGAVITRDVPPHAVMTGIPARQSGWACHCGAVLGPEGSRHICPESACGRQYEISRQMLVLVHTPETAKPVSGVNPEAKD